MAGRLVWTVRAAMLAAVPAVSACRPQAAAPQPESALMAGGQGQACVERLAAERSGPGAASDAAVHGVLAGCETHLQDFARLTAKEIGANEAESLAQAHRISLERRARAIMSGTTRQDAPKPMTRLRDCLWSETIEAAAGPLEGEALVRDVRERCRQVEGDALADTIRESGRNDIPLMMEKMDRPFATLILRIAADVRAGRDPRTGS